MEPIGFDRFWSHDIVTEKLKLASLASCKTVLDVKVNNGRKILIIYSIEMEIFILVSSNYCHIIIK